jgi:SAM-dependent methyltransferase
VSEFSAQWLALREPFDAAARSTSLVIAMREHLDVGSDDAPLAIVDLGAGAGSNLRFLAPLLGGAQRWRLVDHDPALLDAALAATQAWALTQGAVVQRLGSHLTVRAEGFACEIECARLDLADLAAVDFPAGGLVTAAALLDLVSRDWLETLARRCRTAGAAVCFALTYDGRTTAVPGEPEDATVLAMFNRHQLFDKGFGPALGMRAASAAEAALEAHGYELGVATSDWAIGRESRLALTSWHERRRAHVLASRSKLSVGHVDLVGWL